MKQLSYDDRRDYTHRKIRLYTYLVTLRRQGDYFAHRTVKMTTVYNLDLYGAASAAWHLQEDNPGLFYDGEVVLSWDLLKIETINCKMLLRDFYHASVKGV